jgi:multimeric flavodoxin WrbA
MKMGSDGKDEPRVRLLGISGSPRKGNSLFLLGQALDAAVEAYPDRAETETYSFGQTPFAPCDACQAHKRLKGECRLQDGFQNLRDKWLDADAIIYSVPVYHMGIPGQVKCFIDRLGNSLGYYFSDLFPGEPVYRIPRLMKIIGSITQGSHIFAGQEHAQAFINTHALLMRCIPVSGDLWESYIGVGGWTELSPKVSALKTLAEEGKPDAQIAVRSARALGKRVVETALIIREGLARNEGLLAAEPLYLPILKKIREKGSLRKLSEK